MGLVLAPIAAYQVHHLPMVKAYADQIGLVEAMHQLVPTEMAIDPGTIVLGMLLDTWSGRSPLSRVAEGFACQDTALLLGKAVAPGALDADTVGRVLDRRSDTGTMQVCTACAVRADQVFGLDKRSVPCETTSVRVYGESWPPEDRQEQEQEAPFPMTYGHRKAKRPDLKQGVFSPLCVDRAVPLWGTPHAGKASEKTVQSPLWADSATCLAQHGVAPGASLSVADAALVTEHHRAALGDTLFLSPLPATENACGRLSAEAVAHHTWDAVGVLAHTQPTQHRPATSSKTSAGTVTLYGTPERAGVLHSSAPDTRRPQRRERASQAS